MSNAGQLLEAGRIPGELIAKAVGTTDSGAVTAEAVVMTVAAPLVTGRTYECRFWGNVRATTGDRVTVRIREDSLAGTILQESDLFFGQGSGSAQGRPHNLEAEHTAASTANKTFVVTLERLSGAGTVELEAGADHPAFLRVYYQEG